MAFAALVGVMDAVSPVCTWVVLFGDVGDALVAYTVCTMSPGFLTPGPNIWMVVGPLAHVPAVDKPDAQSM